MAEHVVPEGWHGEESLRGEFLRSIERFAAEDDPSLGLERYLGDRAAASPLAHVATIEKQSERRRVLAEATALGTDLLSGEEPHA